MHPFDLDFVATFLLRIFLAILIGLALGFEREGSGKAAGLKTTMLVCLASCSAMLLSIGLHTDAPQSVVPGDPARLAAGVLAGMGFLGAGVIMRHGNNIHGVTTAAVLWLAAILGLVIGGGYYILGAVSTGLALFGLWLLPALERRIKNARQATLTVSGSTQLTYAQIEQALTALRIKIEQVSIHRAPLEGTVEYEVLVKFRDETGLAFPESVTQRMSELPQAQKVAWRH